MREGRGKQSRRGVRGAGCHHIIRETRHELETRGRGTVGLRVSPSPHPKGVLPRTSKLREVPA